MVVIWVVMPPITVVIVVVIVVTVPPIVVMIVVVVVVTMPQGIAGLLRRVGAYRFPARLLQAAEDKIHRILSRAEG